MAAAMASSVTALFVQVFPPNIFADKLEAKLEIYFQSSRKSGGGECNVKVQDLERGIYSVRFWSEEVKKRVKAQRGHTIEVGGKTLEIRILSDSELAIVDATETMFTKNAIGSLSASLSSNFLPLQNDFKNKHEGSYAAGHESGRKKIFLEVSATLNTDLLTKEQRNQVIAIYPTLNIDRASSRLGIEKVVGSYEDIEKLHCHFENLLRDHRGSEFLQPKKQENCVEGKEDHNRRYRSDLEDLAKMEVPSATFEYFRQAYKEEIKKTEEVFNVKLVTGNTENGITSVWFSSMGVPNFTKKAQDEFILLFQKVAGDLKQETVPFIESHVCEMIKSKCKHIIIKFKDKAVLQGPTKEVSDAKALLDEMTAKNQNKKKDPHVQPPGFEVDAAVFAFLRPKLNQKIELINNQYCTKMEEKHCDNDHLTRIIFMPQTYAPFDHSSQASEVFQYEYLMYLESPQIKEIPLKPLEDWKRKRKELFMYFQQKHPKVDLFLKENYLYIHGLPEHILVAEKDIMESLNSEEFVNSEATAIPDSSVGAVTGTSFGPPRHYKMQQVPSQKPPVGKATEVQQDESCPICLQTIHQKEVLPKCKHVFCATCIHKAMTYRRVCPVCNYVYGNIKGNHSTEETQVVMKSLNSEEFVAANSKAAAIPDSSLGAATGTTFKSQRPHKMQQVPSQKPPVGKATEVQQDESCPICLQTIHQKEVLPKCKHAFCAACLGTAMNYKPVCPVCNDVYGNIKGNQPPGIINICKCESSLPGHKDSGTIVITYQIFDGIQTERHPHPGKRFRGTVRTAYLPDNKEGREILKLLQRAFDQGLIFTVGQSRTTGADDVVTWNDIHHKTSTHGGEKYFGYPDPNYLKRVREELKAKGIE